MNTSRLKRPVYPMPEDVKTALLENGLSDKYWARPPYQQNDYIGWICRAKLPQTRQKRLDQMIAELVSGTAYMGMKYTARQT